MRERGVGLLFAAASVASCQLVWSYDGLKQQPGTGGASEASKSSSSSSSVGPSSSGGGLGGAGGASFTDAGDAGVDAACFAGPDGSACTDICDRAELTAHESSVESTVYTCTADALGAPNPSCIVTYEHFTPACASCWAALGACARVNCLSTCGTGDVYATGCNDCLIQSCDCQFTACSGILRPASVDAGVDAPCD